MKKYIYGFDIGGTTVKIGLFSLNGKLIKKWEIRTNKSENGKHIITDIYDAIKNYHIPLEEIVGYGFGVPGPVVDGKIIQCVNLGWYSYDLKSEFSSLVNSDTIYIENDANVATLGETYRGAAKGYKNSALITIGTGVGGGFVVDSKIVNGVNGAAGELGHIKVKHHNGRLCNCGNEGCLETITSATGIKNEFKEMLATTTTPSRLRDMDDPSVKMIFDAAKEGDQLCIDVIDNITYYLGYLCHIISLTYNPNIIVIGGGVSKAGSFFIDRIKGHFDALLYKPVKETKIVKAELGNDAGIIGAASLVIK